MCLFASLGAASLVALSATAQTPAPTTTATSTPAPADSAPVKLPYGVEDVLKLSRAQVSEDVILNYIHNSGTIYNLSPKDIVYLRNEGVSDRVINTMLDQRKNVPAEWPLKPPRRARPLRRKRRSIRTPMPLRRGSRHHRNMPRLMLNRRRFTLQPQPTYAPASTVYVIPYSAAGYGYANGYPYYYGGYYRYYGPSVVFGFGYRLGRVLRRLLPRRVLRRVSRRRLLRRVSRRRVLRASLIAAGFLS